MIKYVEKYGVNYLIDLFLKEGRYTSELSARVHASYKFGFNNGFRFDLMNEKMYLFLSDYIEFDETYKALKTVDFSKLSKKEKTTIKQNLFQVQEEIDKFFKRWAK